MFVPVAACMRPSKRIRRLAFLLRRRLVACCAAAEAQDYSPPAMLQWFETSWNTMQNRTPDLFMAGYGGVWTPPPYRADTSNLSVGYDVYDRFDLGSASDPTLYGTQAGLQAAIGSFHQAGVNAYADMVWNHNGYSDLSTAGFYDAGGYPGFNITLPNAIDGDFHSAYATGDQDGRLAGLIDIDQLTDFQMIRSPVPGYSNNIRAGTVPAFGRLANVPTDANRALYPDQSLNPIIVYDPYTGEQNIKIYPYNLGNPMNGTPVAENAVGYLMRNTQWMVQVIGFDGFRIDAAKNFPNLGAQLLRPGRLPFLVSRHARRQPGTDFRLFRGLRRQPGLPAKLYQQVDQPGQPGPDRRQSRRAGFSPVLRHASNLSGNGYQNSWYGIENASIDVNDDGLHNGSQGVKFVQSADNAAPTLADVAYAYTLLTPGNAIVYMNGKQFGNNRSFPQDGRGDALGGVYGNTVTTLLNIRNTHPSGNYIDAGSKKRTSPSSATTRWSCS